MSTYALPGRCLDLSERQIDAAVQTRERCTELLAHLAKIAKPKEGAPKMLMVFARMATQACDWLDGTLRLEILGDAQVSVLELMSDLGGGMRERIMPSLRVDVPLTEFVRATERVPHMIAPLVVTSVTPRRLILTAADAARATAHPAIEIADQCLAPADATPPAPLGRITLRRAKPKQPATPAVGAVDTEGVDKAWEP